jgi:hypothetical protein
MGKIGEWSFGVIDYAPPFLRNETPTGTAAELDTLISVDVLDDYSGVDTSRLDAYIDGSLVFSGPATFVAPYNGPSSSISPTIVDGYDGYSLVFDNTGSFSYSTWHVVSVNAYDNYGNFGTGSFNFRTGVAASHTIGPFEINIDLFFTGEMQQDDELIKPTNYQFDKGMYARLVDVIDGYNIRLWVELLGAETSFTLTIDSDVTDSFGNSLISGPLTVVPFFSTADLGNYNRKVRTWRESNLISADSERIYLAGTRGIDVFRKVNETYPVRWGQIFDSYGVDAMFVANFNSDLVITDTLAPFLTGQSPAPDGTGPTTSSVAFTITDIGTAVEITSTTVYVDDILAFSGGINGWSNGYSGTITVGYRELLFNITSETPFTLFDTVNVRVVATDLLGNTLDITYSFLVTPPLGFGFATFGTSSFGGI